MVAVTSPPTPNGVMHTPKTPAPDRPALLGKSDWKGYFTAHGVNQACGPMDQALKAQVLKYGDLAQVTYNNFCPELGQPKKPPGALLVKPNPDLGIPSDSPAWSYNVEDDDTFYLTATSGFFKGEFPGAVEDLQSENWIGFVGVSEPQGEHHLRDIVVAFRGTIAKSEWLTNITSEFADWSTSRDSTVKDVRVSLGFDSMYRRFSMSPGNTLSVQGQVQVAVRKLLCKHGKEVGSISVTGHSLGGALASLCAFDIANSEINHQGDSPHGALLPVTAFTFEAPRMGNQAYANCFAGPDAKVKMLRVVNIPDIVPRVPFIAWRWLNLIPVIFPVFLARYIMGVVFNKPESSWQDAYHHGGTLYQVDISALVEAGELKAVSGFDAIAQNHDLSNVLSLIDMPGGSLGHTPRKVEEPAKTRGRSNALKQRGTWQERRVHLRNLHKHISNAVGGLFHRKPKQQGSAPFEHPGRTV